MPVEVYVKDGWVIERSFDKDGTKCNYWLTPRQAEEKSERLNQAAMQARNGPVPELNQ